MKWSKLLKVMGTSVLLAATVLTGCSQGGSTGETSQGDTSNQQESGASQPDLTV